ncbi:MAG: hypothetical protein KDA99_03490 [Planctomycetales bacterium]|nr:hypothetical protein [Planctomycetales bacterium]
MCIKHVDHELTSSSVNNLTLHFDATDDTVWQDHFGLSQGEFAPNAVPEPTANWTTLVFPLVMTLSPHRHRPPNVKLGNLGKLQRICRM